MTRSLFDTARQYRESFDVYGSKKSASSGSRSRTRSRCIHTRSGLPEPRDPAAGQGARLRQPAARADPAVHAPAAIQDAEHLSFLQGGGHGGSHPHLVHNFLMACVGEQPALPDAATSANWTMVGICAHESALKGGEKIAIPRF